MSTAERRVAAFTRHAMQATEWDPAKHDGQREPWDSMTARMDEAWPASLAKAHVQETMTGHVDEQQTDHATERRRLIRSAWVLPADVPADLAARCDVDVLNGSLLYDDDADRPGWPL